MNTWYAINKAANKPDEAEVMIYDAIGNFGITADQFVRDIKAANVKTLHVRLNTPGGAVIDGTAIYNSLRDHPARKVMHIDGAAFSAGSFIAMAGDEVRMASNAYMMIHNAHGGVMGEAEDMRRQADVLDKMNDNIAGMYETKTGKPKEHWRGLMNAETWFNAEEAKAEGLVDVIDGASQDKPRNVFDFAIYNKVPDAVIRQFGFTDPLTPEESAIAEPPPASLKEIPLMASDSSNQAASVQASAPANNGIPQMSPTQVETVRVNSEAMSTATEGGKKMGRIEGRNALMDEFRAIVAVCPGRPQTALNAILAGQNASTVKLIVDAEINAEISANKRLQEQELEMAKLRADNARFVELNAIGGHAGVSVGGYAPASQAAETPTGLEPAAQAKLEWDSDPMIRAKNKENEWVAFRTQQLKGNVRVFKKTV